MNTKQLKSSQFPKMLGDLAHSNQFFKMFSMCTLILTLISSLIIFFLINKDPIILTLSSEGKILEKTNMPKVEDLLKEGINRYLEKRYIWAPSDIQQKMKDSSFFVSPTSQKAFNEAIANVTRFSLEKQVSQTIYPSNIEINIKDGTANIIGDRVTSIQGLKAAGNLKLQLTFETGPRTIQNPWGIYIIKEKEEQ
jgi:hypothetical protein